jgi:hypothetical protein
VREVVPASKAGWPAVCCVVDLDAGILLGLTRLRARRDWELHEGLVGDVALDLFRVGPM